MRTIRRLILGVVLLTMAVKGYCGISTYNSSPVKALGTYTATASVTNPIPVIWLQDDQHHYMVNNAPPGGQPLFINNKIKDFLSLQFTGESGTVYPTFTVTVNFKIDAWDTIGNYLGPTTGALTINYNPAAQTTEIPRDDYELDWGDSIIVSITGVTYTGTGSIPVNDVELTSRINVDRYWEFNQWNSPSISGGIDGTTNTLNLSWSYLPGAEKYDLEWVFVSAYAPQNIAPDFSQATRITTTEQGYNINAAFDIGTIYYRIRGVGPMEPGMTEVRDGEWSPYSSVQVQNIDKQRNWTYSSAYAEQGKRKEVLSYFDGSSRQRQAVTENNSSNIALVSETMYDYEGRVGVTTMAAPNNTDASIMQFYQGLNLNISSVPYSRKDFNVEYAGICNLSTPNGMNVINGSANYYSQNNTLNQYGLNAAIPASGLPGSYSVGIYPFTETLYGIDGKVAEQAEAGSTLNEGNGHTTQYFYATPFQTDLDKVFGYEEAGDASHYQEKAVQDPNGQLSISYLNMAGNVVATSITLPPNSVTVIPNQQGQQIQGTSGVLQAYTSKLNPWNKLNTSDDAMEISTNFLNKNAGATYYFQYDMNPSNINTCLPSNVIVGYDLDIKITDECNNLQPITSSLPAGLMFTDNTSTEIVGYNLTSVPTFTFSIICTNIGTYYINKKLSLDPTALTNAESAFNSSYPGSCGATLASIQQQYNSNVNTSNCNTCNGQCEADASSMYTPNSPLWLSYVFMCETGNCNITPPSPNPQQCDEMLANLKADMSPGGQYFDNIPAATPILTATVTPSNNWLSANMPSSEPAGLYTWQLTNTNCTPNSLPSSPSWQQVRDNWQPCFADYLVQFHPEYCRYNTCVQLAASNAYDYTLAQSFTQSSGGLSWAENNGTTYTPYVDPSTTPYNPINVLKDDPFYNGGPGSGDFGNVQADISTPSNLSGYYYLLGYNPNEYMLWDLANWNVTNHSMTGVNYNSDQTWQEFLALYEQEKQHYIQLWESANNTNECQALCDAGTNSVAGVPTGIAASSGNNCNGNPAAAGFYIREPDMYNAAQNAITNPTTYTSAVEVTYGNGTSCPPANNAYQQDFTNIQVSYIYGNITYNYYIIAGDCTPNNGLLTSAPVAISYSLTPDQIVLILANDINAYCTANNIGIYAYITQSTIGPNYYWCVLNLLYTNPPPCALHANNCQIGLWNFCCFSSPGPNQCCY